MPATLVALATRGALCIECPTSSIKLCVGTVVVYPKDQAHSRMREWITASLSSQ